MYLLSAALISNKHCKHSVRTLLGFGRLMIQTLLKDMGTGGTFPLMILNRLESVEGALGRIECPADPVVSRQGRQE